MSCIHAECAGVTISPSQTCAKSDTTFICSATYGHPGLPTYHWTQLDTGVTFPGALYTVRAVGFHYLQCTANYIHDVCPEYSARCQSNITVKAFGEHNNKKLEFVQNKKLNLHVTVHVLS